MPRRRLANPMLEGITVEWFEVESIELLSTFSERKWDHQRKAAPCERLLPSTLVWAQELPPNAVPGKLMERFPRIANLLAANWKERSAFRNYVQSLLTDQRGNRQGFSTEIKEELVRLRTYYYLGDVERSAGVEVVENIETPASPSAAPGQDSQTARGH